jgi:hypothetical protein
MHLFYDKDRASTVDRSPRAAFVLVMVLVLLAVAALSLAGLARRSLESAEQAATAQAELQRRWGVLSALRLYLPQAESLLETEAGKATAQGQAWPFPPSVAGEFVFHDLRFSVLVADEDAKVNLNAIYRQGSDGANQVAGVVEQLVGNDGTAPQIRPIAEDAAKQDAKVFRSWGQIFDLSQDTAPGEAACRLRDETREMTCWGSGRLNICRASDQAIRSVCQDKLNPDIVAKLVSLRREAGIKDLDDLLTRMALRIEDRALLERRLADWSTRHSIWIVVRDQKRAWVVLALDHNGRSGGGQSGAAFETFTW